MCVVVGWAVYREDLVDMLVCSLFVPDCAETYVMFSERCEVARVPTCSSAAESQILDLFSLDPGINKTTSKGLECELNPKVAEAGKPSVKHPLHLDQ